MSEESIKAMLAFHTGHKPPPKGQEWHLPPGATEPQLRAKVLTSEGTAEAEGAGAPQLKGKLPEDFPGHSALEAAGITTYAKVRKQLESLTEVDGIGDATAEKIREAMTHPAEEEEPE